jgi:hypothetical protein
LESSDRSDGIPRIGKPTAGETELKVLAVTKAIEAIAVDEKPKFAAAFQY